MLRPALIAAALLALALPAAATAKTREFRTPSGNIGCLYSSSGGPGPFIRCDVLSEGDNGGFFLKRHGKAKRHHITDTVYDPARRSCTTGRSAGSGATPARAGRAA
jgi:hypothetical protein